MCDSVRFSRAGATIVKFANESPSHLSSDPYEELEERVDCRSANQDEFGYFRLVVHLMEDRTLGL